MFSSLLWSTCPSLRRSMTKECTGHIYTSLIYSVIIIYHNHSVIVIMTTCLAMFVYHFLLKMQCVFGHTDAGD